MTTGSTDRLAVLIDADNVPAKHAAGIFEEIAKLGEADLRRIYGDFSNGSPQGWDAQSLAEYAILAHQQFANTTGKNSSDIALVIDAMDILYTGRFSGFVLVSSDSDFTRLASRIREQGVSVFGIGEEKAPWAFKAACNRYISIENIKRAPVPVLPSIKTGEVKEKQSLNHAFQLIRNVVNTTNDPDGWATLPFVERQLGKIYPDFDPRSYGYRKLSDLVRGLGRFDEADVHGNFRMRYSEK